MKVVVLLVSCFLSAMAGNSCPTYPTDTRTYTGTIRDVWGCADPNLPNAKDLQSPSAYASCGSQLWPNQTKPACLIANSGWQCAQDFERWNGAETKMLESNLDPNTRLPVLRKGYSGGSVMNPTQFNWWYQNQPIYNIPIPLTLTTSNAGTCDSLIYQYSNPAFFMIDYRGFGNQYANHNFGFTFSLNLRFVYQGDEHYSFTGDDDVFVFINDKWALDLGGVHGAQSATLDLTYPSGGCGSYASQLSSNPPYACVAASGAISSIPCACILGLTPASSYTFDFFYNERHTSASDIAFSTSLIFVCPFTDWCGVCQGDGQSCCKCTSSNKCQTAKCDPTSGACQYSNVTCQQPASKCQYTTCELSTGACSAPKNISCDDNNKCTADSCADSYGCINAPLNCDDGQACTADSCDPSTGCSNVPIPNCNPACKTLVCNGDICTTSQCDAGSGNCVNTSVSCDDGNACTTDKCTLADNGCTHTPIDCDDGNACTVDSCDSKNGCQNIPMDCNDNNKCTEDKCVAGNCTHPPIQLTQGNYCLDVSCDPLQGEILTNITCPKACQGQCDPQKGCQKCPGHGLSIAAKAGIGAGAIAGIVIAAAAFAAFVGFGGKKGYDVYMRNRTNLSSAQTNPMYTDSGRTGNNPFYEANPI